MGRNLCILLLPTLAVAQNLIWLETPPAWESKALSISADGRTVVGQLLSSSYARVAYSWVNTTGRFFPELG